MFDHPSIRAQLASFLAASILFLGPVPVQSAEEASTGTDIYTYNYKQASRDGTGKYYMGREISHVMGHLGAGWLERPDRERDERTDLLLERLPLAEDFTVVDLGAGTG